MKNLSAMFVALSLAGATPFIPMGGGTAYAQTQAGEVTGSVYDSNGLFILNETGNFLWGHLEGCESDSELIEKLLDE